MRELTKVIRAFVGEFSELIGMERRLLITAMEAREKAQAPYSRYMVGVAILCDNGCVRFGCNVERCSWTQTTHAEQNAIDGMVAEFGPSKVRCVALVGAPAGSKIKLRRKEPDRELQSIEEVPVPCGHCLQIIWENCFNDPAVPLIALAPNGEVVKTTIGDAFPMRFGPNDLGVDYEKDRK